jgi:hypothetical protein
MVNLEGENVPKKNVTRRDFMAAAVSAAAAAPLSTKRSFAEAAAHRVVVPSQTSRLQTSVSLVVTPGWKDQGIENLAQSPHAKLHDVPVRAVTITGSFWAKRREINLTRSIPTMHDLLESNGRMNNFRRLVGRAPRHAPMMFDKLPQINHSVAAISLPGG